MWATQAISQYQIAFQRPDDLRGVPDQTHQETQLYGCRTLVLVPSRPLVLSGNPLCSKEMYMKKLILLFIVLTCASLAFGQGSVTYTNAGTTGTTLNSLAIINTSNSAVIASTSNTGVPTYVVVGGAGSTGLAVLGVVGQANCTVDSTIASAAGGFYVIASVTTGGDCHAQSAAPSFGTWVVGYLASASTSSGSTAAVPLGGYLFPGGGRSGLSGMTATQVPIAATASTITSSEALAGAGAGITTGPVSGVTTLDVTEF